MTDNKDFEIGRIVNEVSEHIISLDPSPKMILHEPYRSILSRVEKEFEKELRTYEFLKSKR